MPLLDRLRNPRVVRVLLWTLHILLVVAVLVGLWWVNRYYRLDAALVSPAPWLHDVWLPLLFLLLYLGGWAGYWFYRLLSDTGGGRFPDIDDAWAEALAALDRAGIDPAAVPLFLVVGRPKAGAETFFAATGLPFAVRDEPRRADAPVKVYATREAVFVTCEGASVLARLADQQAINLQPTAAASTAGLLTAPVQAGDQPTQILSAAPGGTPTTEGDWLPRPGASANPGLSADTVTSESARLRHLGRRIADSRRPYCSCNGILWLLPAAGTASEAAAEQTAAACRADLMAAEGGLQVVCPSVAVAADAQELPGFRELAAGLPDAVARERLLGRSFPLVPTVPPEQRGVMYAGGVDWIARQLVPGVAYQRFGSEAEGTGERWSAANARLWGLTADLFARRAALTRVLTQGLVGPSVRPPMVAGLYLAGTGPDRKDHAFAAGLVAELLALQNYVTWTAAAAAEERDHRRTTAVGYAVLALGVGLVAAFGWVTWRA